MTVKKASAEMALEGVDPGGPREQTQKAEAEHRGRDGGEGLPRDRQEDRYVYAMGAKSLGAPQLREGVGQHGLCHRTHGEERR